LRTILTRPTERVDNGARGQTEVRHRGIGWQALGIAARRRALAELRLGASAGAFLLAIGLGPGAMPASAQKTAPQVLKISHQFHETADARGRAARVFAEELGLRAPELKTQIFPQLALGLARDEQLDALQAGTLDFAVLPLVFSIKRVPEFSLALLPGLLPTLATAQALKGSQVHDKLQEIAAANGLRIITWWWMRGGFAAAREIGGPASVKGMTVQSCGLAQQVLAAAGAKVADDPWGEINMRMEMGALEGVAVPYEDFISMRLHEHAKFATFGGPSILTCFSPLLMSKRSWDRLTPDQQNAIDEAAEVADSYFETSQIEAEKRALAAFQRAGAKIRSITPDEYMAWLVLAQRSAWADYVKVSPASRDLLNTAIRVILTDMGTREEVAGTLFTGEDAKK
jgi:TRAP-type transport system periplasmic protein